MLKNKGTIIYIGNFIFPDKNAAAQRVINIGKIFSRLNYTVVYISILFEQNKTSIEKKEYFGYTCYEYKVGTRRIEKIQSLYNFKKLKRIIEENKNVKAVIAYNLRTFLLYKLYRYCKKNNIKSIGDITEWYGTSNLNFLKKIKEKLDIYLRMNVLNYRMSGNIVISDFLYNTYVGRVPIVNIPPLVDLAEDKWEECQYREISNTSITKIIYAGSPSKQKERLDLIVEAVTGLNKKFLVELSVLGITQNDFCQIYDFDKTMLQDNIVFYGKVPHKDAIRKIAESNYSIIIRDKNRITNAGFPTKFVESISAGTPVITNDNSCVKKYMYEGKNGYIVSIDNLEKDLSTILDKKIQIDVCREQFHYENYIEAMDNFIKRLNHM